MKLNNPQQLVVTAISEIASGKARHKARASWNGHRCVFCSSKKNLRVGLLPTTGKVYFCNKCHKNYTIYKNFEKCYEKSS